MIDFHFTAAQNQPVLSGKVSVPTIIHVMDTVIHNLIHLLQNTETLIRKAVNRGDDPEGLAAYLEKFRKQRLEPLDMRLHRVSSNPYVLSMVGLTNVGKSSLAKVLLGHPIAPSRNGPATAMPVEYKHATEWCLQTYQTRNQRVIERRFGCAADLSKELQKKVFEAPSDQDDGTLDERLVVVGPMDLLKGGLVFVDTPGFGAAYAEDSNAPQDDELADYLLQHVHEILFCISARNAMVSRDEKAFFEKIQHLCSTVVVTKWTQELEDGGDIKKEYEGRFSELFPNCLFFFVDSQKQGTGMQELQDLLQDRREPGERTNLLKSDIEHACKDLDLLIKKYFPTWAAGMIPWDRAALANFRLAAKEQHIKISDFT